MGVMERVWGEVFIVRRDGRIVAEPTGGVVLQAADAPPQTWFAAIDLETVTVQRLRPGSVLAEIELLNPIPGSGMLGRVVQLTPVVSRPGSSVNVPPARRDEAMELLERVPDEWQPYEVRSGELDADGWQAFVGTLFPVPDAEKDRALGIGWRSLMRIEPWLLPGPPSLVERAVP